MVLCLSVAVDFELTFLVSLFLFSGDFSEEFATADDLLLFDLFAFGSAGSTKMPSIVPSVNFNRA
jgi:hypothetical protein